MPSCAAGSTVSVSDPVALCAVGVSESVAWMVKVEAPDPVGVPLTTPVLELRPRPSGSEPEVTDYV
jgi:hypothetical protein